MQKRIIVLRRFGMLTVNDLITRARAVIQGTIYSDAVTFPAPAVSLADLSAATTALEAAHLKALNGGRLATTIQRAAKRKLVSLLTKLAKYAEEFVENSFEEIAKIGFQHSKAESTPVHQPLQPVISVIVTRGGGIEVRVTNKTNALTFIAIAVPLAAGISIEVRPQGAVTADGPVILQVSTKRKMQLRYLPRSTPFKVYVLATNTAGNSLLSAGAEVTTQ